MNLVRRRNGAANQVSEFDRLRDDINRFLDFDSWPETTGLFDRTFSPSLDVVEQDNEFTVTVDLPGVAQTDIDITVVNNVLTIRGEKHGEAGNNGEHQQNEQSRYYRKETWSGSFQRTVSLPDTIDADNVEASMENGVLSIHLPKREEAKPRRISVNVK